jgi:hypothetical protein
MPSRTRYILLVSVLIASERSRVVVLGSRIKPKDPYTLASGNNLHPKPYPKLAVLSQHRWKADTEWTVLWRLTGSECDVLL